MSDEQDANAPELYRRFRPQKFSELIGQEEAMKALAEMGKSGKIPHVLLLQGPSGTGKTTAARILRKRLDCSDIDTREINASDERGIDMVRDIIATMPLAPSGGKCKVYIIDECQLLTQEAQSSLLKPLEDTPAHVYIFLLTTDPQKLKKAILTRATVLVFKKLDEAGLVALVNRTLPSLPGVALDAEVVAKIAEAADGSARKAMVILHAVSGLKTKDEQLKTITSASDSTVTSFQLVQAVNRQGVTWGTLAGLLKEVETTGDEPESIRRAILGYARKVLLSSGSSHAADVINAFKYNYFESGAAGLAVDCYNLTH